MNYNKLLNLKDKSEMVEYAVQFQIKNRIVINKIFNPQFADLIFKYISNLPIHRWKHVCGMEMRRFESKINATNREKIHFFVKEARRYFTENRFSYIFHRTMYLNPKEITNIEMDIYRLLSSPEMIELINQITNMNIVKLNQVFVSKYKSGHFLSPHSDKGNGRLAFVINMTKDWLPQYGGNLHFLSDDRTTIIDTVTPIFNNMVLFNIPEPNGIPHFVSHVVPEITGKRYAISGWYN